MLSLKNKLVAAILAAIILPVAKGQRPVDPISQVTRFSVSAGYQYIQANAPPGGCKCFGLNGGYVSAGVQLNQWLGIEGQFAGTHANDISLLGQDLTLMTYMGGPRASLHFARITVYGKGLIGRAEGSDSYFPSGTTYSSTASSLAYSGGGGAELNVSPRFAIRIAEGQYLHTAFTNGSTNTQSHFVLSSGIIVKFRGRHAEDDSVASVIPNRILSFACSTNTTQVEEGAVVGISGNAATLRPQTGTNYAWTTSGGTIQGNGRKVTVDTRGVAPGDYLVTGRAIPDDGTESSDCEVAFHVTGRPQPLLPVALAAAANVQPTITSDEVFHTNVPDALFDYDKWNIRPDAQAAVDRAATYLMAHPGIRVVVGGYSDERGTQEYNIALGLKRANATKDALVAKGVDGDRIQIISYGKGAQVCAAETEVCWQQNRRAAFSLKP